MIINLVLKIRIFDGGWFVVLLYMYIYILYIIYIYVSIELIDFINIYFVFFLKRYLIESIIVLLK